MNLFGKIPFYLIVITHVILLFIPILFYFRILKNNLLFKIFIIITPLYFSNNINKAKGNYRMFIKIFFIIDTILLWDLIFRKNKCRLE